MSKTIWKFTLQPECEVEMPAGAQLLSVREQGNEICLWALVDRETPKIVRSFVCFGTGHEVLDDPTMSFIGTAMLQGGSLVIHVFERQ